ncbi:shikimate dehydrogenase [Virgibacillus phasianinus]|uniref:Shikimate dehydrogenase (NADP(+)) n=1 Tax=Virgibacillus phasianinus TaxID=2017483 RepID=A0A220U5D4_9BACI|nr:shikimate dehydrogenase [Virgibacillus phasianinus]ASK63126.1 shikimate dehydrogenase [Virgibacillus phasianinus]
MEYRFGLVGYPIEHSLSPWIHNKFILKAGFKGNYALYEINTTESFADRIKEIKNDMLDGFNVTVPYKQTIIPYLDDLDEKAAAIGAVNTVVCKGGKWTGYNTDGDGYLRSLIQAYPSIGQDTNKNVLIIGAGGAARGILYTLGQKGFNHIDLANRTLDSAHKLKDLFNLDNTNLLTLSEAENVLDSYDIIIQTTSVGMKPAQEKTIVNVNKLTKENIVSDIVYQPVTTAFLKDAENAGARIHRGHSMLLYQAQYAFELWTNIRVEINEMDQELFRQLEG